MEARLYYEIHLTITPAPHNDFDWFRTQFGKDEWKVSMFSEDDVDNIAGKWFMTAKCKSFLYALGFMAGTISRLKDFGLSVSRSKIEQALFDSKEGDVISAIDLVAALNGDQVNSD